MNSKNTFVLLIVMLLRVSLFAQVDKTNLDTLFNKLDQHHKAMLSMCLSEKGHIVYARSIGYTDIEKKQEANSQSLYHIGSITKMFTSVMIYQLIDEKKLSLDTKLSKFFPTIPNSKKISIGNLLNHRSGLHNFTDDDLYESYMEKSMTQKQMIALFEKQDADFEPDTKTAYSNTNYVILGYIIEALTKSTYETELQKRICLKANLHDTKLASKAHVAANEARSYTMESETWKEATKTDMSIPGGAGAIMSTPADLCKFIETLFAGKLMSSASFASMKNIEGNMGHGIFQIPFHTKRGFGHNGGIDGFQSVLAYFPDDSLAMCILGNALDYPLNDISIGVLSLYYHQPYVIPSFEKKVVTGDAAKTFEGVYSNSSINMKITITKKDETLMAQASGQSAFPLEKVNELEYKFDAAKIQMKFSKDGNGNILSFNLKQSGADLKFDKE